MLLKFWIKLLSDEFVCNCIRFVFQLCYVVQEEITKIKIAEY